MQFIDKKKRKVFINITSLIDVLFLLLIFFMVSSTFVEQPGIKLELPETKSATVDRIKELMLEIDVDGSMILNQESIALDKLEEKFKQLLPSLEEKSLVLKADKSVPHGTVVKVMDIARLSGIEKLVIATRVSAEDGR